jgi:hypothetical protein
MCADCTVIGDRGFSVVCAFPCTTRGYRHVLSFLVDEVFGIDPGLWCCSGPRFPEVVGSIVADAFTTLSGFTVRSR